MDYFWYGCIFIMGSAVGRLLFRFIRHQCACCEKKLSPMKYVCGLLYPILAVFCVVCYGFEAYALWLILFAAVLIVAAGIDCYTMMIPDCLSLIIIGLAVVRFILSPETIVSGVIGFFILSVPMLFFSLATDGFGGGDIKLTAACGLFLGYRLVLFGFFLSCIPAALWGLSLLVFKKAERTTAFPFGPFLASGFFTAALLGPRLL
jgi:leader peptidase (prepilin peptidase)/N-methyltransferase